MCAPRPRGESGVFEIRAAEVVIERGRVAGEIRFHDIEIAVEIVIGGGNAHARLRLAVRRSERNRLRCAISDELAVVLVLVQRAGGGIVGDVDVGPAIVVEIAGQAHPARKCRSR